MKITHKKLERKIYILFKLLPKIFYVRFSNVFYNYHELSLEIFS